MIFAVGLQDDGDDGHDGFDDAELQSRLENTLQFRRQTGERAEEEAEGHVNLFVHLVQ